MGSTSFLEQSPALYAGSSSKSSVISEIIKSSGGDQIVELQHKTFLRSREEREKEKLMHTLSLLQLSLDTLDKIN